MLGKEEGNENDCVRKKKMRGKEEGTNQSI